MTAAEVIDHQRKHGFLTADKKLTMPLIIESPDRIDFFMEFNPPEATSQQKGEQVIVPKGGGRPFIHHFKKKHVEKAEKELGRMLTPFKPKKPFEGPVRLVTEWTWAWRASEPKRNRVDGWKWRDTKPDFDNISKMLVDQMAALGFLVNDSQIADGRVQKKWGDRPGIRITLELLAPKEPDTQAELLLPPAAKLKEPDLSPFE